MNTNTESESDFSVPLLAIITKYDFNHHVGFVI